MGEAQNQGLTRRQLIKDAALITTAASLPPLTLRGSAEVVNTLPSYVAMVDFAPERPIEGIKQDQFPSNRRLTKAILGDKYIDELRLLLKYKTLDMETLAKRVMPDHPEVGLMYGAIYELMDHGRGTATTMRQVWQKLGINAIPAQYPLQDCIDPKSVTFNRDELGNYGIHIAIESQPVISAVKKLRQNNPQQKVVNLSFIFGELGARYEEFETEMTGDPQYPPNIEHEGNYYIGYAGTKTDKNGNQFPIDKDGNRLAPVSPEEYQRIIKEADDKVTVTKKMEKPSIQLIGGYNGEQGAENIQKLFEVCKAFPDMLVVAATGNEGENLRDLREKLGASWPKNLLLVGEWAYTGPATTIRGADIYVPNKQMGIHQQSSFSAPVVSALAAKFMMDGASVEEAKDKIFALCNDTSYTELGYGKPTQVAAKVLDPAKLNFQSAVPTR